MREWLKELLRPTPAPQITVSLSGHEIGITGNGRRLAVLRKLQEADRRGLIYGLELLRELAVCDMTDATGDAAAPTMFGEPVIPHAAFLRAIRTVNDLEFLIDQLTEKRGMQYGS